VQEVRLGHGQKNSARDSLDPERPVASHIMVGIEAFSGPDLTG
jgi:hypothetical protein